MSVPRQLLGSGGEATLEAPKGEQVLGHRSFCCCLLFGEIPVPSVTSGNRQLLGAAWVVGEVLAQPKTPRGSLASTPCSFNLEAALRKIGILKSLRRLPGLNSV